MIFSILILDNYNGDFKIHFGSKIESIIGFESLNLSYIFVLYLVLLSIFCVNSINIYAGISGLETGQAIIIALSLSVENLYCMLYQDDYLENLYRFLFLNFLIFSFICLLLFSMISMVLFYFNKPSKKTFVGDTFCYFAGSLLAWTAIIGKYPIKVMFFFLPQLFNFLISLPQLFGIVHCPRHRLPIRDPKTNKVNYFFD